MSNSSISRRSLLKRLGMAAAAIPVMKFARLAGAAGEGPPQRLVLWPSMNGSPPEHFWPNPGNLGAMSLVTEPLRAYQSKTTFVRNLRIDGSDNHFAVRSMFSGAAVPDYLSPDPTVKSIDQVVADHFQSTSPAFLKSLHLGAIPADSIEYYQLYGRSTFFFSPSPVHYEANPVTAFDRTFGDLGSSAAAAPGDYEGQVLDITEAELDQLGGKVTRSPREAQKLAAHKAGVVGLRSGPPVGPAPTSCDGSTLASVERLRGELAGNAAAAYQHRLFDNIMDAQVDIMARALTCGITRVATLQAGSADGNAIVPVDGGYPHHNTSHGDQLTFARCQQWYASKFVRLLDALNVPDPLDPGKTVLDNSCVVWLSECLPTGHGSTDVPAFFVGGAGGTLKTGSYVDAAGATNKMLLKTICRALGVSDGDTGHFGSTIISELRA